MGVRSADDPCASARRGRMMGKTITWLGICLPWIAAMLLVAMFCVHEFVEGFQLTRGMHGFRWLFNLCITASVYFLVLLIAVVSTFVARRRLRDRRQFYLAVFVVASSAIVPMSAVRAMSTCFFRGRDKAYSRMDHSKIYEACRTLSEDAGRTGGTIEFHDRKPEGLDDLPEAIARLRPTLVNATKSAVVIQLDGGGPMYHEGIGVIVAEQASCPTGLVGTCRRLDAVNPVFLYRLYDYRVFLERVEDSVGK